MDEKDEDNVINDNNSENNNLKESDLNINSKSSIRNTTNSANNFQLLNEKGDRLFNSGMENINSKLSQISKDLFKIELPEKIHCPQCDSNIFIRITDTSTFEIEKNCSNCKNKKNMKLEDFVSELTNPEPQKCNSCNNNSNLYKCKCGENICENCKDKHLEDVEENLHNLISFTEKDYKCVCSGMGFNCYCTECKKNLCFDCMDEHEDNHQNALINLLNELPPSNEIEQKKKNLEKQKKEIEEFIKLLDDWTNELIERVNKYKLNLIYYNKLNEKIINNYDTNEINYESLQNMKNMIFNFDELLNELKNESLNDNVWERKGYYILKLMDNLIDKKKVDVKKEKKEDKENEVVRIQMRLMENAKKSLDVKKNIKSVCVLKKKKLLAVGLQNKKINFYGSDKFEAYSNLNEKGEIIELSEMSNGNLLICANGYFKIFRNNDENNGGNEIQFEKCKNIKKVIESKNGRLICLCDNPNENNGLIQIFNYDPVNKNYKPETEIIKLDSKPFEYLIEMNSITFAIYLQTGNLVFYQNDSLEKINYQKKPPVKNSNHQNINESKAFKINDDIVAVVDSYSIILISLGRNAVTCNRRFKFFWDYICVLSNGKILASVFNYDNNSYNIKELVYNKTAQIIEVTNYDLFDKPQDKLSSYILELSNDRLVTFCKENSVIKIWDIANK